MFVVARGRPVIAGRTAMVCPIAPPEIYAAVSCLFSAPPPDLQPYLCATDPFTAVHITTGAILYLYVGNMWAVVVLNALFEAFEYSVGIAICSPSGYFAETPFEHLVGDPTITIAGALLAFTLFRARGWPSYRAAWADDVRRRTCRDSVRVRDVWDGFTRGHRPLLKYFAQGLAILAIGLVVRAERAPPAGSAPRVFFSVAILVYYIIMITFLFAVVLIFNWSDSIATRAATRNWTVWSIAPVLIAAIGMGISMSIIWAPMWLLALMWAMVWVAVAHLLFMVSAPAPRRPSKLAWRECNI